MLCSIMQRARHASLSFLPFSIPIALCLAACGSAQGGQLEATTQGDLSSGPAPRGSALGDFTSRCGEGRPKMGAGGAIDRLPYVQRTTADSTDVVFTADVADAPILDLTTPD